MNKSTNKPISSQPGNGGNWPSTTGKPSGGNRSVAVPAPGKK